MCMHAWTVLFFLRFILMGRFCLFSSIFQLPFYTLVFSEWGCFFNSLRFFNPSVLWALPLYDFATPRNAAGHGKGRGLNAWFSFPSKDSFGCTRFTLFVHSSQQREERTKKRRRGYRAFGSSLRSPSGSAELASLGQSSPFSLRLPCVFTAR